MESRLFESIKLYVGFDDATSARLRAFHDRALPEFPAIIDDFYRTIERDAEAYLVVTGGREQIARLKLTLLEWMQSGLRGPHDIEWVKRRSRIGLVHVRIGLPQRYMLAAMNRIRVHLVEVVHKLYPDGPERLATIIGLHQLLDIELAIMLHSYQQYLADRIRTAERLATIGQLAASISHELRNPLGIIESSMFLLGQRIMRLSIQDPTIEKHQERIQNQVALCGRIVGNLLDLARDRPPARRREQLRPLVERIVQDVASTNKVELQIAEDLQVDVDPDDLRHVLSNLINNASEAMGAGGKIHIQAEHRSGGTEIVVQDEGPGVAEEIRDQIFDALFTTKARGTGLGLALCRRILFAHGGEIELLPSERGARFRLWFPEAPDLAQTPDNVVAEHASED